MADREMTNEEAIEILGGIRACYNIFDEYDEPKYAALSKAIFALKAEPAKHGRWVGIDDFPHETWECDRCGKIIETDVPPNYCENCGARMIDEVENG